MTLEQRLVEIYVCLQTAVVQSLPSDDQIIMGHVRNALAQTNTALAEIRAEAIAVLTKRLTESV